MYYQKDNFEKSTFFKCNNYTTKKSWIHQKGPLFWDGESICLCPCESKLLNLQAQCSKGSQIIIYAIFEIHKLNTELVMENKWMVRVFVVSPQNWS
mgnify:CR=1 FL=1